MSRSRIFPSSTASRCLQIARMCQPSMTHTHSTKNDSRRYRYYVCLHAQKRGWKTCPSQSVPAAEIEQFVIDQIRCIGKDTGLVAETLAQARAQPGLGKGEARDLEQQRHQPQQGHEAVNAMAERKDFLPQANRIIIGYIQRHDRR